MTDQQFDHQVDRPGVRTDSTLAELFSLDPMAIAEQLRGDLEQIRSSERDAEKASAEVRLY